MAAADPPTVRPRWLVDRATDLRIAAGLAGLAAALALRVQLAGVAGARSIGAGLVFAAAVSALAGATAARPMPPRTAPPRTAPRRTAPARFAVLRLAGSGVLGGAVLCLPAALRHAEATTTPLPLQGYASWALGVAAVAVAEEALLRGSLFTAVQHRAGTAAAIAVTSVAFALMHVPLYGASVIWLDLAVGVWLGVLRAVTGSVGVPAVAHALADLAGWWLQ